jgi:hypothetical protein
MQVIAPGLTPRGRSDRVKTDPKDSELLARCLMAGSLTPIVVPSPEVEAARELTRAHDACRRDLMNARHRVSKMLLRHGRVYPKSSTWTQEHRRWLAAQQFEQPISELTYADLIASIDGLTARKKALAKRIGELALDEQWWPTARSPGFQNVWRCPRRTSTNAPGSYTVAYRRSPGRACPRARRSPRRSDDEGAAADLALREESAIPGRNTQRRPRCAAP